MVRRATRDQVAIRKINTIYHRKVRLHHEKTRKIDEQNCQEHVHYQTRSVRGEDRSP